jgi:hypothetical protein
MSAAVITASASVVVAALSYLATYYTSFRMEKRRNQLDRVNQQLARLYGPLYSLTQSNGIAYRAMRSRYDPDGLFDQRTADSRSRISLPQKEVYKLWMTTVLQPANRDARDTLLKNTDLLVDGVMPTSALNWCTHVAGYEAVLAVWAAGDDAEIFSLVPYPQEFTDYVAESFELLQARQAKLLSRLTDRRRVR